jgi:Uma2 family endonuclease
MAVNAMPPLVLESRLDNPEHYEFLRGRWAKKESVGRADHSTIELIIYEMLRPTAKSLGARVLLEWTVVHGQEKIIPDVTFSFPNPQIRNGYLVAPAFLVVESRSKGQRLNTLIDKCLLDHHRMGTLYCWIVDSDEARAYECHHDMGGARQVETLTAGPDVSLSVAAIFAEFEAENL